MFFEAQIGVSPKKKRGFIQQKIGSKVPLINLSHSQGMKTNSKLSKPVLKANFDGRKITAAQKKYIYFLPSWLQQQLRRPITSHSRPKKYSFSPDMLKLEFPKWAACFHRGCRTQTSGQNRTPPSTKSPPTQESQQGKQQASLTNIQLQHALWKGISYKSLSLGSQNIKGRRGSIQHPFYASSLHPQ